MSLATTSTTPMTWITIAASHAVRAPGGDLPVVEEAVEEERNICQNNLDHHRDQRAVSDEAWRA
jgi:hypothetical protein